MESKDQVKKHLQKHKADDIRLFHTLMTKSLLANNDFMIALEADKDDGGAVVEEELNRKLPFSTKDFLTSEEKQLLSVLMEQDLSGEKLKKAQCIEQMSIAFSNDKLLEGFCLAFYESDEALAFFMDVFGCSERYAHMSEDPVYQKRRKFSRLLASYTDAAVNLYGVVHVQELHRLIIHYEGALQDWEGYIRPSGEYRYTITFSPEWMCTYTLHQVGGNLAPLTLVTLDGFILHDSFRDDLDDDIENVVSYMKKHQDSGEDALEAAFESVYDAPFRRLWGIAAEKEAYLPSKKEFLRYANPRYYEISNAEKEFKNYLWKHFRKEWDEAAKIEDATANELLDELMDDLHYALCDIGGEQERDLQMAVQYMFDCLYDFDISLSKNQPQVLIDHLMKMANSTRLWSNHGHTPSEMLRMSNKGMRPEDITIVPGSSHAAQMLSEAAPDIQKMGFGLDLDATASEISTTVFPDGMNGTAKAVKKKIYPNDPCPCGSGKKYKKCCGRS